ncbi:MAG: anaerobic ribonucleoside-triphosphate reductase activating protein [bacterium]|nr:anaerobic ribonucleoside-triphosphate reductase activating protein [bacterium]
MLIAGFQKLTLLDYPDKLAALIFTQGCNFACDYCHNAEMISPFRMLPYDAQLEPENILTFLSHRIGKLDGVVISGGEPTLQPDLDHFLMQIKAMGFLVKLDTNGSHPEVVKKLIDLGLLDFIAMDIKYSPEGYRKYVKSVAFETIQDCVRLIMTSGVPYEFRSTLLPYEHNRHRLQEMGEIIQGAERWYLQNFRPLKTLSRFRQTERGFAEHDLDQFQHLAQKYAQQVAVRV